MHATDADYIGISQTGRLVAVDQTVTAISHLVELESMSRDRIRGKFPPRDRQQHAKHSQESRRALRGSGPGLNARNVGSTGGPEVFERDAIASCYTPLRTAAPLLIPNFS
jgi:hypothetical protein